MGLKRTEIGIDVALDEYNALSKEEKIIKDRKAYLSKIIKEYAENNGAKDSNGSFYAENDNFIYGKQAKKSISFNTEKALEFLDERGFEDCIIITRSINEKGVEDRLNDGDITNEDLESITETKITYAVSVKQKEEMPEVDVAVAERKRGI